MAKTGPTDPKIPRAAARKRAATRDRRSRRPRAHEAAHVRVRLPPHHPLRALVERASRVWGAHLLDLILADTARGAPLPQPHAFADFLQDADLADQVLQLWQKFRYEPAPQIVELKVISIEPPPMWRSGQTVRVNFLLRNTTSQPTSGFVHGTIAQGVKTVVTSGWLQPGVTALQPGLEWSGVVQLRGWSVFSVAARGGADVNLAYYVQVDDDDPRGEISFVWPPFPGQPERHATYGPVSYAYDSVDVPPRRFAVDIRSLFRDYDVREMNKPGREIDLSSYADVKKYASDIYKTVNDGSMPCGYDEHGNLDPSARWSAEWVTIFKQWMDDGMLA